MAADHPMLLALDTSTEMAGLALYDGQRVSEAVWHSGRNQTSALLERINQLLSANRLQLSDIDAFAVAVGPGMFNGLRVGLSTAKGLGYGREAPVYGVDTLEVAAYPHRASTLPIRAFVPAGRGRVVFGDYRFRNGRWVRAGEFQNRAFIELTGGLSEMTLVTGEIPPDFDPDEIDSPHADVPRPSLRTRRPGCLAEIAWNRWRAGATDDLASLEPLYVHGSRTGT